MVLKHNLKKEMKIWESNYVEDVAFVTLQSPNSYKISVCTLWPLKKIL